MRCSPRPIGLAVFTAFLVLMPVTAVFAEDDGADSTSADDTQIEAAGAAPDPQPTGRNLNTIPEDGMAPVNVPGPDNIFVRRILAARPNEDLVICVAGCFSGRDRVVYAQPAERVVRTPVSAPQSSLPVPSSQNLSSAQSGGVVARPSRAASAEPQSKSQTPSEPIILNPTN